MKTTLLYTLIVFTCINVNAQMKYDTTGLRELLNSGGVRCGNAIEMEHVNNHISRAWKLLDAGKVDSVISWLLRDCFTMVTGEFYEEVSGALRTALYRKYSKEQIRKEVVDAENTIVLNKRYNSVIPSLFNITLFNTVISIGGVNTRAYYYYKYGEYGMEKYFKNLPDSVKNTKLTEREELFGVKEKYKSSSFYKELSSLR